MSEEPLYATTEEEEPCEECGGTGLVVREVWVNEGGVWSPFDEEVACPECTEVVM